MNPARFAWRGISCPVGSPAIVAYRTLLAAKDVYMADKKETPTSFIARVGPEIVAARAAGKTLQQIANRLNTRKIAARRGRQWTAPAVLNVLNLLVPKE